MLIILTNFAYSQQAPVPQKITKDNISNMEQVRRSADSAMHPEKFARTIEEYLLHRFSVNNNADGKWVFYNQPGSVEKIKRPLLEAVLPGSAFYKVRMTNFLGYHVNNGTCMIVYDSLLHTSTFNAPLWYSGISEDILRLFMGHRFGSKDSLLNFLNELNEFMETGSVFRYKLTAATDSLITYDLGYTRGDSYTTGGNGTSSTISYKKDDVWRFIIITIKDFAIVRYESVNPVLKSKVAVQ